MSASRAMSAMSEDSFDANLEESPTSRGRDPRVTFVTSSWIINLALSQIDDNDDCLEPWEVFLPANLRSQLRSTASVTFMRLDGVLEAFFQSRMRPIKLHVKKPLCLPSFQFGTADVAEVKTAPANCRVAELFLFTDVFASSFLSRFIDQQEAMRHWLLFVSGESSGMRATHALVRKIACPGRDGPELKEWLHDAFTALQTARYSPNGEEERLSVAIWETSISLYGSYKCTHSQILFRAPKLQPRSA